MTLRDAYEEARAVLERQLSVVRELHEKSGQLARTVGSLLVAVGGAAAVAVGFTEPLRAPAGPHLAGLAASVVLLVASLVLAAQGFTHGHAILGFGPPTFRRLAEAPLSHEDFMRRALVSHAEAIERNDRLVRRGGSILLLGWTLFAVGASLLAVVSLALLLGLPPRGM